MVWRIYRRTKLSICISHGAKSRIVQHFQRAISELVPVEHTHTVNIIMLCDLEVQCFDIPPTHRHAKNRTHSYYNAFIQ